MSSDTCAACGGFANGTLGTNNVPICSGCIRGAYADLTAQVAAAAPDIDVVFPPGLPASFGKMKGTGDGFKRFWGDGWTRDAMTAKLPPNIAEVAQITPLPPNLEQRVQELHDYYSSRPVGSEGGSYHGNGAADVLWLIQALRAAADREPSNNLGELSWIPVTADTLPPLDVFVETIERGYQGHSVKSIMCRSNTGDGWLWCRHSNDYVDLTDPTPYDCEETDAEVCYWRPLPEPMELPEHLGKQPYEVDPPRRRGEVKE